MTFALIYRALERNTGSVGLASVPCESIQAVNPEIAALQQHQDPASDGAEELNKQIAAILAQQIAAIGGDPTLANEASTFAPGEIGDPTGAGNTCDDEADDAGCINTLGLRVDDLSEDEILAAVSDGGADAGVAAGNASVAAGADAANASNADAGDAADAEDDSAADAGNAADAEDDSVADAENAADAGNAGAAVGGAVSFGACNPAINFGIPSDGRNEDAFEPADLADFNHGSALNINVISQFICSQLGNNCDVDDAALDLCDQAAAAADGLAAQAAADAFNQVLGV